MKESEVRDVKCEEKKKGKETEGAKGGERNQSERRRNEKRINKYIKREERGDILHK